MIIGVGLKPEIYIKRTETTSLIWMFLRRRRRLPASDYASDSGSSQGENVSNFMRLKCLMIVKTLFDSFGLCKRKRY